MSVFLLKHSKTSKTRYVASVIHYGISVINSVGALIHSDGALIHSVMPLIHSVEPVIHSVMPVIHSVEPLIHSVEPDASILLSISTLRMMQKIKFSQNSCCGEIFFLNSIKQTQIFQ
jgi:hypothetical protein